jgi:drug/metabolite transporter (DMT)-like permease
VVSMELSTARERPIGSEPVAYYQEVHMKWAGMYFVGFALLIGGVLAALWKLGILQNIETTWIVIGVVILAGIGIMASIASSGTKQNIEIDHE